MSEMHHNAGMQRMMDLMADGNPGMQRMMELMRQDSPGMHRMHSDMPHGSR